MCFSQSSDADVVARPAEDGGGQQEGPDEHELHQVTQQPGRAADCVRGPRFLEHANVLCFSRMPNRQKNNKQINRKHMFNVMSLIFCISAPGVG